MNKISTCPLRNPQCSDQVCTTPPPGKSIGSRWLAPPPAMGRSSCEIKGSRQFSWREHAALPFTAKSEMNSLKIWKWIKISLNSLLRHLPPMLQETCYTDVRLPYRAFMDIYIQITDDRSYLLFVTDTTDGVCVKKIVRCKF